MQLPLRDLLDLNAALDGMLKGGNPQIVRRNSQDEIMVIPFKLSADVYQWAATLLTRLHEPLRIHEKASAALFKQYSKDSGKIEPGTPEMVAYSEADAALKNAPTGFRALLLPLERLKLDDNPGLAPHLAGLSPVLKMPALTVAEEEPGERET